MHLCDWSIFPSLEASPVGNLAEVPKTYVTDAPGQKTPLEQKLSITKFSKILKQTFFQLVTKFQINFFFSESSFSSFLRRLNFVADNIGIRYQFLFLLLLIWFLVIPRNCSGPGFFLGRAEIWQQEVLKIFVSYRIIFFLHVRDMRLTRNILLGEQLCIYLHQ